MYTEFFALAEIPFRITADPRFLWYSPQHREVKAKILHHIQTRKGPIYLFADVGTGKTSIAKRVHDELAEDKSKQVVFAYAPNLKTSNAFLRFIMDEFAVKTSRNYGASLKSFEEFLLDQYRSDVSPVLLVDEAQNMTGDMLTLIHHLFNFSINTEFLIQVALFGQNELHAKVSRNTSLRSRMVPARLEPLDHQGVQQMIEFRWHVAGGAQLPYDENAVSEIYRLTGGNPRDICKLCDAALLRAFADRRPLTNRTCPAFPPPTASGDNDLMPGDNGDNDLTSDDNDDNDLMPGDNDDNDLSAGDNDDNDLMPGDNDDNDLKSSDNDDNDLMPGDNDDDEFDIVTNQLARRIAASAHSHPPRTGEGRGEGRPTAPPLAPSSEAVY